MRLRFFTLSALSSFLIVLAVAFLNASNPTLQLAILGYAGLNGALGFFRPVWGLWALLFFLPLFNNMIFCAWTGDFPPALILFFGFFGGWLFHRIRWGKFEEHRHPLNTALIAFVALGLGSGLITMLRYSNFGPIQSRHFENMTVNLLGETNNEAIVWVYRTLLVFVSGPALLWAVVHLVDTRRILMRSLLALGAGLGLAAVFGIYQGLGNEGLGNVERFAQLGRINATFTDPNALGSFLILALPVLLGLLALVRSFALRAGLGLVWMGSLYILAGSGSRTGVGGLALALAVSLFFFLSHRSVSTLRRHSRLLIPLLIPLILFVGFFPHTLPQGNGRASVLGQRLAATLETVGEQGMVGLFRGERLPMWRPAILITQKHPLAGIGLGAFHTEVPNFMEYGFRKPSYRDNANNFYLQASAEMGLVGLFFSILVLYLILREAFLLARQPFLSRRDLLLCCCFCGSLGAMVVMYLTGPHTLFAEVKLLFWALNGMVVAMGRRAPDFFPLGAKASAASAPLRWRTPAFRWARQALALCGAGLVVMALAAQAAEAVGPLSLQERRRLHDWESSQGFHTWEFGKTKERFRWTRERASVLIPTWRPLLHTSLFVAHPDAREKPVTVEISLDGRVVRREVFDRPESRGITLLLPQTDKEKMEIEFAVDRTFRPSQYDRSSFDTRELGVLVQDFWFSDLGESESFGFSDWRSDSGEAPFPFRSFRGEAALAINTERGGRFDFHASTEGDQHARGIVELRIFCRNRQIHRVVLASGSWRKITLDTNAAPEESPLLLRFSAATRRGSDPDGEEATVRITRLELAGGQ